MKKKYKKPNTIIIDVDVTILIAGSLENTVTGGEREQGSSEDELGGGARESVINDLW